MIRHRGGLVLLQVTAITSRRQRDVLVVDVAGSALNGRMFAGERELGLAVIEGRAQPIGGRVAQLAILGKIRRDVIGRGSRLIFLQVAGIASRGQGGVLIVDMTAGASRGRMLSGQGEFGGVVIEFGTQPVCCRMAKLAILRESRRNVIRRCGGLILFQVAGITGRGQCRVLSIGMALSASRGGVLSGQWEFGGVVIELGAQPIGGRMARLAIL